jgi:hypothetical protein
MMIDKRALMDRQRRGSLTRMSEHALRQCILVLRLARLPEWRYHFSLTGHWRGQPCAS